MSRYPLWRYSLFQVPLGGLIISLLIALLSLPLGWGRPPLSVAIALDLSSSTYPVGQTLFAPGSISQVEVQAVQDYLDLSGSSLRSPNQILVFGFAGTVIPLTNGFNRDHARISQELTKQMEKGSALVKPDQDGTNIDEAITHGVKELKAFDDRCRELILVTDGAVTVSENSRTQAVEAGIKVHSVVIGQNSVDLAALALTTGGAYIPQAVFGQLRQLFTDKLFIRLNSNSRWVLFWLGVAWICLMWVLVLPLDRWFFQGVRGLPMHVAGQLALGHALFWTLATPGIVWRIAGGLALFSPC